MSEFVGHFPASQLRAKGGDITCTVFENPSVGLERSVFWSVRLEFEPIGEEDETSMTCEWIPWKFQHWKELDRVSLTADGDDEIIEGSFYVCGHDPMEKVSMSLRHVRDNLFELSMEMVVDYNGSEFSDPEPHLVVKGCAVVPFTGLYLGEGINLEEVADLIDISAYESEPLENGFGMLYFKPKPLQ